MPVRFFPGRMHIGRTGLPIFALFAAFALAGCGGSDADNARPPAGGKAPEVAFITAAPSRVPLTIELAGRTAAYQTSEVRPQVSGIIRKRYFTEGSIVKTGEKLYQIDPSLYQAMVQEAKANLASARASAEAARMSAERYRPLAELEAVSQQALTDAEAAAEQAQAAVEQMRAKLETAEINLRYTDITAPITGRIGRSLYTVGALVTANQADVLAVIQTLDPMFVDIQQSSADMLALRKSLARNGTVPARADVRLRLEDGSDYSLPGAVEFSEAVVSESTGTVTLRARFPNKEELLLPGMFVRAIFAPTVDTQAFLVPQAAVSRDPKGNATVWIVDQEDKAQRQAVTAERTVGADWVVTDGLKEGDRVIVEGTSRIQEAQSVRPVVATAVPNDTAAGEGAAPSGQGPKAR